MCAERVDKKTKRDHSMRALLYDISFLDKGQKKKSHAVSSLCLRVVEEL